MFISQNEERDIAGCIESVLNATGDYNGIAIILVDSASTDRTIEIAEEYPIIILQLRHYIQFHCGDTILDENWFGKAIPILGKNELVAGEAGNVTQEMYNTIMAKRIL